MGYWYRGIFLRGLMRLLFKSCHESFKTKQISWGKHQLTNKKKWFNQILSLMEVVAYFSIHPPGVKRKRLVTSLASRLWKLKRVLPECSSRKMPMILRLWTVNVRPHPRDYDGEWRWMMNHEGFMMKLWMIDILSCDLFSFFVDVVKLLNTGRLPTWPPGRPCGPSCCSAAPKLRCQASQSHCVPRMMAELAGYTLVTTPRKMNSWVTWEFLGFPCWKKGKCIWIKLHHFQVWYC